jgi:hypothetical protein
MVVMHTASGGAVEADIRISVATLTCFGAFAAMSVHAAPLPPRMPTATQLGACPPIEKVAQERGSGWHPVPCDERWGHCNSDNCSPTGIGNRYRMAAARAQVTSSSKKEYWRPLGNALTFELGDQGCGDGWHQALWLDWRGEWWWGPCVPNR